MKKLSLTTILFLSISGAHAYQFEVKGQAEYFDTDLTDGNFSGGIAGTYYFKNVDIQKGPYAEAAFLNHASNVSIAYNYGQLKADIKYQDQKLGELKSDQHSYGVKAETYIPTNIVPLYASASYNHSITEAKNDLTKLIRNDDEGDRYALEVGAMLAPNFLVAVGYTSVAATNSLDTFNILNNGLMSATMESRSINDQQDAVTARAKYIGAIQDTNMSIGFEAGLVSGEETLYQLKSDLYFTPKLSVGVSYTDGDYHSQSVPTSALGANINYFITPAVVVGASYVYADGENLAKDAQLGAISAKFRF